MKTVIYILIGAVATFIILKVVSVGKPLSDDKTTENLKLFLATSQAKALVRTPEFYEALLTKEFFNLSKGIATQYLKEVSKQLGV
jgi:hypothetical protein